MQESADYIVSLDSLSMADVPRVGGKNASLGEMLGHLEATGIRVPDGFATTADAFRDFLEAGGLRQRIAGALDSLDIDDVRALAKVGAQIRSWVVDTPSPKRLEDEICAHYQRLVEEYSGGFSVAVRSSATAEDLPDASFAGQQETYLNVDGIEVLVVSPWHSISILTAVVQSTLYNMPDASLLVHGRTSCYRFPACPRCHHHLFPVSSMMHQDDAYGPAILLLRKLIAPCRPPVTFRIEPR